MLNSNNLLHLLYELEPILTEKNGALIPYGMIYKSAKSFSHLIGREQLEMLLLQLEKLDKIEIIYMDKPYNDNILGIRVK